MDEIPEQVLEEPSVSAPLVLGLSLSSGLAGCRRRHHHEIRRPDHWSVQKDAELFWLEQGENSFAAWPACRSSSYCRRHRRHRRRLPHRKLAQRIQAS